MRNLIRTFIACALLLGATTLLANDENSGSGTVAETMNAGGYVYVRLVEDGTWLAGQPVPVAVGDKVEYSGGMTMKNFRSPSLERTFENIYFVGNLQVFTTVDGDAHAEDQTNAAHPIDRSEIATAPQSGEITPVAGGKTVAEILSDSVQLSDQQISLRARVMKVNLDILGKNWFTLQDGTGTAPNNKLIATSSELAEIGEVISVSGVVRNNIDLGSGYNYKVLLEEATFSQ